MEHSRHSPRHSPSTSCNPVIQGYELQAAFHAVVPGIRDLDRSDAADVEPVDDDNEDAEDDDDDDGIGESVDGIDDNDDDHGDDDDVPDDGTATATEENELS